MVVSSVRALLEFVANERLGLFRPRLSVEESAKGGMEIE